MDNFIFLLGIYNKETHQLGEKYYVGWLAITKWVYQPFKLTSVAYYSGSTCKCRTSTVLEYFVAQP